MREAVLVQRARRGDLAAFNQLVADHEAVAFSLAFRLLDDRQSAEDAVAQSVLLAFQQLDTIESNSFLCFLLRRVVHTCRKLKQAPAGNTNLSEERIQQGLNLLPFEHRLALLLWATYGLSRQEIEVVMDASAETVTQTLSSGRVALRTLWFGQMLSTGFQQGLLQTA